MKKIKFLPIILIICLFLCSILSPSALALDDPGLESRVAIVMDRNTSKVYYSMNSDQLVYPASTTKIMTVLLAIEAIEAGNVSIYDEVTASSNMEYDLSDDGSTAGIRVGETMTLEDLLYCAMLSSANEACNIIGEYIGGTIPAFIDMMNAKAKDLGCVNTHFANTHGLPNENHYTTAEDFCRIAMEAAGHELFMEICSTASIDIPATNMSQERHLNSSNALICTDSMYGGKYLYEYAAGIKTGFTSDAGYCLVSTASNGEINLLAAVFGGYSYTGEDGTPCYTNFEDTIDLYEWVFNNFSYQEILKSTEAVTTVPVSMGADADSVSLRPENSLTSLLPNDFDLSLFEKSVTIYDQENGEELSAPISAGQVLGEISVSMDGVNYGTVKLVASSGIELSRMQYIKTQIRDTLSGSTVKIIIGVLLLLVVAYLALVIRYRILHARHKKAVRAARAEQVRRHRPETRPTQADDVPPAEDEAPKPPKISYFTQDGSTSSDTSTSSLTPEAPDSTEEDNRRANAERDYFEEFFRQK